MQKDIAEIWEQVEPRISGLTVAVLSLVSFLIFLMIVMTVVRVLVMR